MQVPLFQMLKKILNYSDKFARRITHNIICYILVHMSMHVFLLVCKAINCLSAFIYNISSIYFFSFCHGYCYTGFLSIKISTSVSFCLNVFQFSEVKVRKHLTYRWKLINSFSQLGVNNVQHKNVLVDAVANQSIFACKWSAAHCARVRQMRAASLSPMRCFCCFYV